MEILFDRGIEVIYETIRVWCNVWGNIYAKSIKKCKRSNYTGKLHVDEVRLSIKGEAYCLWRAIDGNREEIEVLLQKRRNAKAAIRFLKKALKATGFVPRVMVTIN